MGWPFSRIGASGFSSYSTAKEVTHGIDGSGLTAIVTGASSDLGAETARVLALRDVHVIMGVIDMIGAKTVKEAILKEVPTAKVDFMELDLSSMTSIRNFASNYNNWCAYGQSKLANILHANELARRLKVAPQRGASTTCYVALHPQVSGINGKHFADNNLAEVYSHKRDVDLAKKLWDFSINLTK
ncbi:hypothetical protein JHK87_045560 [Glycine soja]|nr:hypothetical protein JHK87_045560 [Glycine soja]